ncbi:DHA2 family efflux MFS transporter permease subunit [Gallaecimonas mangrovi]|uniref:DHA2 family efflux MFS transporter permease subunit n=1 Tax=Gallaecimonas mangrovi TaxID=2291597 RepID=UPI000E20A079|nr:DHA2 family efflux MFS transporter permease subunit [Gallaecimonas mangrovi]
MNPELPINANGQAPLGPRRWLALVALSLAQLMDVLDNTIVNIALPSAQQALGFSINDRQWIITGYALTFGSLLLLGGRLSDLFGRKRLFIIGVSGFVIASAVGGAANGFTALLLARIGQGMFAALLAPAALSLLAVIFADNAVERAKAFGIFGAVSGIGGAVGLVLGGLLTETLSWRWCLYVNLIFGLLALLGAFAFIPRDSRPHRQRLDVPGALISTLGLVAIVYGLGHAALLGWQDARTLWPVMAGIVLLAVFIGIERHSNSPLLPLRVVLHRVRGAAYLTLVVVGMGMFAVFLFLTYYLQGLLHFSPVLTGVAFLPMLAAVVASAVISGAIVFPRFGPRPLVPVGCVLAAIGMLLFTRIGLANSYTAVVLPALLVTGLGFGMIFSAVQNAATSEVADHDAGIASAMVSASQQIGGAIGIAVFNSLAATSVADYLTEHAGSVFGPQLMQKATLAGDLLVFWAAAGIFLFGALQAAALFPKGRIKFNGTPTLSF